jgi:hypothetical protein
MSGESLDRIRIVEANFSERKTRIVGEAAGAYPSEAGVERYEREVILDPQGTLQIRDRIETRTPKKVEWNLNADTPFQAVDNAFAVNVGDVVMDVITHPPAGATFERRAAHVKAPGPPGSLTSGSVEERGYQLVITVPPASKFVFETTLRARREGKAAVTR